jgi:prepilin-type N-terminal cleavage/methylation domain-containing protein
MKTETTRPPADTEAPRPLSSERGFSLVETLVALLILLIVMGAVMGNMIQFSKTQSTVWNRANMHGAVRSATELLQQEVGQAGKVTLPTSVTLTAPVTAAGTVVQTVSSSSGMFVGEQLAIDAGDKLETVAVTAVGTNTFTATFANTHAIGAPVAVLGGFATGVVPTSMTNGSTGSVLKIYGDINGTGSMVYVEYVCDTSGGNLYRNMMAFNAATKPSVSASQILLSNLLPNPGGTACFTYEPKVVNGTTYVVNVAISLTTQTQFRDRVTKQFQTETKALLNVAPRNVFDAWLLASMGVNNRVQPMPPSVTALLH